MIGALMIDVGWTEQQIYNEISPAMLARAAFIQETRAAAQKLNGK